MISIVDYGMGNIGSISNMLQYIGVKSRLVKSAAQLADAEKIILPGVGAFDAAMRKINESGLREALERKCQQEGVPVLGICLGMQLLTRGSEEGRLPGLGWIAADTLAFRGCISARLKVPHMGWNTVVPSGEPTNLSSGFDAPPQFYFVHSFFVACDDPRDSMFRVQHGINFDAGVRKGNLFGVQFHPEKSHRYGMRLLKSFAEI